MSGKAHLDGPEGVRVDEAVPRRALDLIDNRAHLELVHRRVRAHGLAFLYRLQRRLHIHQRPATTSALVRTVLET